MNKSSVPEHERLFDEICGKLNELSFKPDELGVRMDSNRMNFENNLLEKSHERLAEKLTEKLTEKLSEKPTLERPLFERPTDRQQDRALEKPDRNLDKQDKFERLQNQFRRTQEDWKQAQEQIQERMKSFETFSFAQGEMSHEVKRLTEMLEQERQNNVRMSADLAKALELNLKLQFDIEESRAKANQMVSEERKHNSFLVEKNKSLQNELELAQALNQDIREELSKAREKFQLDQGLWTNEKSSQQTKLLEQSEKIEMLELKVDELENFCRVKDQSLEDQQKEMTHLKEEAKALTETVESFEAHSNQQNEMIRKLSSAAEHKMVELKLALDKKSIESNDYYSHLQQALTQIQVLKQENSALKEYISKITALHKQ